MVPEMNLATMWYRMN
jgi:hypothetical protein